MQLTKKEIEEVAAIVSKAGYWGDGQSIFSHLGVVVNIPVSGNKASKIQQYLKVADHEASENIRQYFEVGDHKPNTAPWPNRGLKLFISHRDVEKAVLAKVAHQLNNFGIVSFLAHDAIEKGTVWREGLELGLNSMDALLAYCSEGFSQSDWTQQEVGYALGKKIPIVSVMAGDPPKGLLEQKQAIKANLSQDNGEWKLARGIYEQLRGDESVKIPLCEGLAREMKFSGSCDYCRSIAEELVEIDEMTHTARNDTLWALRVNDQTVDVRTDRDLMRLLGQ